MDSGSNSVVPCEHFERTKMVQGGTLGYMAPESCSGGSQDSKEADMHALGMVVCEVTRGSPIRKPWLEAGATSVAYRSRLEAA